MYEQRGALPAGLNIPVADVDLEVRAPEGDEDSDEEEDGTDQRIAALERQMSALTSQMDRIEKLLQFLADGRPVEPVGDGGV